ncbi:MAG: hypothetical protein HYY32_05970 [Chloroflexi bacterium]|nr:hypothetical protein [Chloroflexota bacterium]
MNTKLVLDECIERLRNGETVEQCLTSYPHLAAELEPLLSTAAALRQASSLAPRPEFRAMAKARVLAAVRENAAKKQQRQRGFFLRHAWAPVAASFVALLAAGSGTVVASADSLPGQPLYPVKMTVERAQLAVTSSQVGKAKLLASFADRRVKEIGTMVEAGHSDQVESASVYVVRELERIPAAMGSKVSVRTTGDDRKSNLRTAAVESAPAPPSVKAPAAGPAAMAGRAETRTQTRTYGADAVTAVAPEVDAGEKAGADGRDEVKKARNPAEVRAALNKEALRQKKYLEELLKKAPARDRPAIQKAIRVIVNAYEQAAKEEGERDK